MCPAPSRLVAIASLLASAVAGAGSPKPADTTRAERPNILLIVIDTLRADHLSCYGYERRTSPNIDRLAAEGVLYENSISAASWTLPGHASLFTGLYPRDHRATGQDASLDPEHHTLAERLRAAGYRTAGFSNNVWLYPETGLQRGFETFDEMWREQPVRTKGISHDDPDTDMAAAETNERILAWLDGPDRDDRPFFVFINYFEPHLPYRPTRPYDDDFLPPTAARAAVGRLRSFYKPREYGYILRAPWMEVSDRELAILTSLYDGEIAYVDAIIGQLLAALRERGLLDDTVVAITSDHGEHLGENHMLDHKFSLYEPLLRVPLILWNPRLLPSGLRIGSQVQAHDLFGTLLELGGAGPGEGPLLPFEENGREHTFAELAFPGMFLEVAKQQLPGWDASPVARALKVVRGRRHKLIWGSDGRVELYDIVADPLEANDLAAALPAVVERLRRVLSGFHGAPFEVGRGELDGTPSTPGRRRSAAGAAPY